MIMFSKSIWTIFQICVINKIACEPQCSKFDFEEKLLEKLVRMEYKMTQMETEIGNLRDQLTKENIKLDTRPVSTIAFMSRDPSNYRPVDNHVIVFKTTLMNHGRGYDNITGVFTAPANGVYLFTTQFCIYAGERFMYYGIMRDSAPIKRALIYDKNSDFCTSSDAVVVLKASERVWVECVRTSAKDKDILWERNEHWNTFSGVMIHN